MFLFSLSSIDFTSIHPIFFFSIDHHPLFSCLMALLRLSTFVLQSLTVMLSVLLFWIFFSFWAKSSNLHSTVPVASLGKSGIIVSVSIDFLISSVHCTASGYIYANWDVPRKDIFNLGVCVATESCQWFQSGINVNISYKRYQAIPL